MKHEIDWQTLSDFAWSARKSARPRLGGTAVGAAVVDAENFYGAGCNIQHTYRNHIHAEIGALTDFVAMSPRDAKPIALLVAAEVEKFTPCGACMDWIMELGGPEMVVGFQSDPEGPVETWTAHELMPHYPIR